MAVGTRPRSRRPVQTAQPEVTYLSGAAATSLRPLLEAPRRPARVLAAFPLAVYLEVRTRCARSARALPAVAPGDHVIPLYTPECRQCKSCLSGKTNLCTAIRATQGKGLMPDGTTRFSYKGQPIFHYMGCSTFSNFTVLPEIAVAKIREDAPFQSSCYIGCGVTTGVGAVINTAKVQVGDNVVVFGLGGIGLNVIQGARLAGADKIIGVDINPDARGMGPQVRHDRVPELEGHEPRGCRRGDRPADRRRRRLHLRRHRQYRRHAHRARSLPPRLGHLDHHRRRRSGQGNRDASVPARHRPQLARHRVRRRQGPHRCAEDCRHVYDRQDRDRPDDHARHGARRDQQGL